MADSNGTKMAKKENAKNEILELNLDNCRKDNILSIVQEHPNLETLSLINVSLATLKGFPKLPNLKKLELSDNRISNDLNYLTTSPKLQYLNLSGNKIKDLETLEPLKEFKHLSVLDLFNNEATQVENYREKIFKMMPSLKFLDGFDCNDVEVPSDGEDDEEVNGNDSDDDDSADSLDEGEEEEDDDEEDDPNDLNILEIYNDDLEDCSSDWEGGDDKGEEDDEILSEDDDIESEDDDVESDDENAEAKKSSTTSTAAASAKDGESSQPPGKKRKVAEEK